MSTKWLKTVSASLALTVAAGTVSAETLRVVTDPSFVPFEMMDQETGEMIGFDMEIIREVADRAGFEIDLNTMDFNGIIPALQTGNVDIAIAGITITEEREEIVDFSDPYYDSGLRILVRESNGDVSEFDDLEGKKIGTKIGSTSYDYLVKNLEADDGVTPYPGSSDMYMALMSRSIDAVFYDAPNVGYFARTKGEGKVKTVGPLYEGQQYGIALKSGSEWVDDVNEALAAMKEDGTYKTIYEKWFGPMPEDM
ncbi:MULTISPECIES: transporter substrate-binding domain-containing protein [Marinobacter]|jgi:glutamine transport system substrate-binding protein|uniref:Amino acid ABC transporter substrate-binding protein n=2 Tax=Marinobacter TaxID=2742 RepID=A0A5M3PY83_9GAMM|nr:MULTISPECIES: transporter substrate-binding domain-containing protein [Marinobacter]MTI99801.1 transporter substrate-binding domain-containing protein [Marinobacter adhaerens]MBO6810928.1 transporter substrate-binding domain-containing protein [Marinobacter sp.]MBO6872957.1 transporter substrate-binding domain-containing protein [Marinobacter sp.]MBY6071278.1 transporter substrate-binding domain-containing protein [Marinobacter salsuginis]QTN43278.1 transporter substrate-binding domain-cont|tara:strand:+ start:448 stop:1206 length:759 start_codon:yes stop_codon:yes gene_type:complete